MNVIHGTRKERTRAARKSRFVEAAARVVATDGLEGLTMVRLADDLDCAVGAVYRYFASKEALIAELHSHATRHVLDVTEAARPAWETRISTLDVAAREAALIRLVAFSDLFLEAAEAFPQEFELLRIALLDPRPMVEDGELDAVLPRSAELVSVSARLLDDAVSSGALRPGDGVERSIVWAGAVLGVLQAGKLRRVLPNLGSPFELARGLGLTLLEGWGADRGAVERSAGLVEGWARQDIRLSGVDSRRVQGATT